MSRCIRELFLSNSENIPYLLPLGGGVPKTWDSPQVPGDSILGWGVGDPPAKPPPTLGKEARRTSLPKNFFQGSPGEGGGGQGETAEAGGGEGVPRSRETQLEKPRNPPLCLPTQTPGVKRTPQRTPSPATFLSFFRLWRACETDFELYETALFCGVAETHFQANLGRAETNL